MKANLVLILSLLVGFTLPVLASVESERQDAAEMSTRGDRDGALRALIRAGDGIEALQENPAAVATLRSLADQYRSLGARSNAVVALQRGVSIAERVDPDSLQGLLVQLGHTLGEVEDHTAASEAFTKALARIPSGRFDEQALGYANLLKAEVRSADNARNVATIAAGFKVVFDKLAADQRCDLGLQAAGALLRSEHTLVHEVELRRLLDGSLAEARRSGDLRQQSYALGYLAWLEEEAGNFDRSLALNRDALALTMGRYPELSYRWQWQLGRVKAAAGNRLEAIATYQQSIATLSEIQGELLKGSYLVFRERVLPVYNQLIDLLLLEAESASGNRRQNLLMSVQETLEAFNKSEVLDYFDDDCLLPTETTSLDSIAANTAVIYPVVFEDRVVIITKLPDGIHQATVKVDRDDVLELVAEFREFLERDNRASTEEIQETAGDLYSYLIEPIDALLEKFSISTLVFVPASQLRMIPMAALYDGEQYLVQRFEIATTLGLDLTDPNPLKKIGSKPLLGGISESVDGFAALPGVEDEINAIQGKLGGDMLMNRDFSVAAVSERLGTGSYSVVHLGTHGVFQGEAANSFLLAYDDRLTLDKLQDTVGARRFSGDPLDLLVLSACETAAGNDRAALGLAGVSLKAGARSTVASLWPISDAATSQLMVDFYGNLIAGKSKAESLRLAQLNLIDDPVFEHPNFWSPFLLIGNWL